ncbi:ubiquinone-menaquinone biosynthesis methyltransferase protein [Halorhabdus tiamatea SARL4B]|uniref:tRNA (guanine(10)-N(2))-dimethyltransferase n=1 Tax=Halorhabdus tiamatea SARL4B TaxID=1033806 RepID=F7PQF5_9EURY|nr:methyltransferase domain-containing protein [Halorhabdus tiamatea]ERJ06081.1 ubiquinone-menaquinone biosynthesis methyltransferase protein [Halorhabdus tiamatea SARL4B]CCQ33289.1 RNA methylase [Halorhabdus tiamatea SARL4B]
MFLLELAGTDDAFAAYEAASAASRVTVRGGGVATARGITDRVSQLALTHRVSELLGTAAPDLDSARALLEAASFDRSGSVAVRARDIRGATGVSTQAVERALGSVLVDRGFTVDLDDPDHELRAVFAGPPSTTEWDGDGIELAPDAGEEGICALGWLAVEPERDFTDRAPTDRPFFQPGSMDPSLARALVNVAGARPDARVLDPMCGTGGLLLEASRVGSAVVGVDALAKMVRGTRENLAAARADAFDVCRGDARRLPLEADAFDAVVVDAPYGRQTKVSADSLAALLRDALAEARRVAPRAVVVGDRPWAGVAREAGWTVSAQFKRRVHRSLDRFIHVLDRRR